MARYPPNVASSRRQRDVRSARVDREQTQGGNRNIPSDSPANNSSTVSTRTVTASPTTPRTSSPIIPSRPLHFSETARSSGVTAALHLDETVIGQDNVESSGIEQQLKAFFQRQEDVNKRMEESIQKERENNKSLDTKRLPRLLTSCVRETYKHLLGPNGEQMKWNLEKIFCDQENQAINEMILTSVRSTDAVTHTVRIRAAMRVHFRTKKRQQKLKDQRKDELVLKEQRRRTRLNTKKVNRTAILARSTTIGELDKALFMKCMTVDYMSSEHSMSESNSSDNEDDSDTEQSRKKVLSHKPLTWRSQALNNVMLCLDRKIKCKECKYGHGKEGGSSIRPPCS